MYHTCNRRRAECFGKAFSLEIIIRWLTGQNKLCFGGTLDHFSDAINVVFGTNGSVIVSTTFYSTLSLWGFEDRHSSFLFRLAN